MLSRCAVIGTQWMCHARCLVVYWRCLFVQLSIFGFSGKFSTTFVQCVQESRNECMRVLLKCCWVHLINMFSWWVSFFKKTYILVHDNFAVTFLPSKQHILTVLSAGNAASEFRDCYPALLSCQKLPSASHDYKGPMRSIIVQSKTANRFCF